MAQNPRAWRTAMTNPMSVQKMVQRRVRRRRLMRRLRTGLVVAGAVIVLGGGAFGIDRMVVALHRYYTAHGPTTTSPPTTDAPSSTTTPPGPPPCASAGLSAYVYDWQATGGSMYETVSLDNISGSSCSLRGYATLGASARNGTPLPAATAHDSTLGAATGPTSASPAPLTVAPGARVWFELSYADVCNDVLQPGATSANIPNACYAGNLLEVTPPQTTTPLLVSQPLRFTYGTAGFTVGPFAPGTPPSSPPVPQQPASGAQAPGPAPGGPRYA